MSARKPVPLYYVTIRALKEKPAFKSRSLTIYENGVPTTVDKFRHWLSDAIEEKAGSERLERTRKKLDRNRARK